MTLQEKLASLQRKLAASLLYPAGYEKRIAAIQAEIVRVQALIDAQ